MKKISLIFIIFFFSSNTYSFGEESQQETSSEPSHSNGEIAYDVGIGIASSAAGFSVEHGNIPGAIVRVATGAKNFISAAKKYNENVKHEKDCGRDFDNDRDHENDSDSWDREY